MPDARVGGKDTKEKPHLRDGDGVLLVTVKHGANMRDTTRHLYIHGAGGPEPLSVEDAILLQAAGMPVVAVYESEGRKFVMNSERAKPHALELLKDRGILK